MTIKRTFLAPLALMAATTTAISPLAAAAPPVGVAAQTISTVSEYAYGKDKRQTLDYYRAWGLGETSAPLIVYIHGGAWQFGDKNLDAHHGKAAHHPELGYNLASVEYRLVPDVSVEDQAADIATSLRYLIDHAEALGIDTSRIVLMGHSAGAHLSALVATDPSYLSAAGLSVDDIAGVIAIDGAAYDANDREMDRGFFNRILYGAPFGSDAKRRAALSPVQHASSPNAGSFLLLHVQRPEGVAQAKALQVALEKAGTPVERQGFAGKGLSGHLEINNRLGEPDYPATKAVDDWLAKLFAD